MDKRTLIGYVLIFVVVVGWMLWQQSTIEPPQKQDIKAKKQDTTLQTASVDTSTVLTTEHKPADSSGINPKYGATFSKFSEGSEKIITVENDLLVAKISNKGGAVKYWKLKKFKKWDGKPSELIWSDKGEAFMTFTTYEGVRIDSRDLFFEFDNFNQDYIKISKGDSVSFSLVLEIQPGKYIRRTYKFFGNQYVYDNKIETRNIDDIIPSNRGYNLEWQDGLRYQEGNSVDESSDAHAVAQLNGNVAELNADADEPVESKETGIIDYIGIKTKYFGMAIIPQPWQAFDGTADLYGWNKKVRNQGLIERYSVSYRVPVKQGSDVQEFRIYIGPLDYDVVSQYKIEAMVNLGWKYGIRQIAEYFMRPILSFIHKFVPNYGLAIIFFSILMKILLHPLSIQQMRSAQKMQLLAPEMTRLREKHKDDQMKQQQAIMGLYSEYGINPAGGCLPMLLQMPILIALWQLLRSAIDLRQANFIFWINDLSVPDKIIDFGFPILGLTHISGLALAMGITMFFQQKLTITDPRQKTLIYMMPVMFTLMFSYFPSGLNLYYFMFNLLSIGQQLYMNKYSKNRPTLESLRKAPKKEGWLQKKMKEAQEIANARGTSLPGKQGNYSNNPKNDNYKKTKPQNKKPR
ncbi:membrane protein insertase YidC [Candidatus Kapaibacterium sp.]